MATINMPTDLLVAGCSIGQARYDMAEASDATGNSAVRLFGPPRWRLSINGAVGMPYAQASKWEALLLQMRGRVNVLAAFDPVRIAPTGTMRGAPFVNAALSAGATSLVLNDMVGTLLQGDWLQIGSGLGTSQVVKLTADASSTVLTSAPGVWRNNASAVATWVNNVSAAASWSTGGTATINFEPPLRRAYAFGTQVGWNRPTFYCRSLSDSPAWNYRAGSTGALENFSLDLLEVFG